MLRHTLVALILATLSVSVAAGQNEEMLFASSTGNSQEQSLRISNNSHDAVADTTLTDGISDPMGHALFIMPTAHTQPQGSFVFRSFQLFFLSLGYAPTNSTSITVGALFPIFTDFNILSLGVKQNLLHHPKSGFALALNGNVTVPIYSNNNKFLWYVNGTASYQSNVGLNGHLSLGTVGTNSVNDGFGQNLLLGIGADWRTSSRVKLMAEFWNGTSFIDEEISGTSLLMFGVRFHGEHLSADIAGIRPLGDSVPPRLRLIPLVNIGYRF